ncbi:glycosyltransferase 6-like [Silene latifolia]|uniref:glycosyltransferase 6-like n=1 Tax=Silene latifolia TaxID=37657 RepID=UPI003D782358
MSSKLARIKLSSILSDGVMFLSGVLVTVIVIWSFPSITTPSLRENTVPFSPSEYSSKIITPSPPTANKTDLNLNLNLTTFYDDPKFGYLMDSPVKDWDEKRQQWFNAHPSLDRSVERVMMVTGSQPMPCTAADGDHLMLRLFKNKVDYCRIHGHDIFYNNVLLHQGMYAYWAKYPLVKAAMLSHPEAEWIWWIDSDAVFTDMDFNLPLEKYKAYNLIVYGWPDALYEHKSSMGLNAGVFLIRNCQWSMNILDRWASFGPQTENFAKWGQIQKAVFPNMENPTSDDQAALCYMILMEKDIWAEKFYLETEYDFQGYFMGVIDKLDNATRHYSELEKKVPELRKKHAEKFGEEYRALWQQHLEAAGTPRPLRRSFVTHFTGCEPCSGYHNPHYTDEQCHGGIIRALNFGDSQVLRSFGYTRHNLSLSSSVEPL